MIVPSQRKTPARRRACLRAAAVLVVSTGIVQGAPARSGLLDVLPGRGALENEQKSDATVPPVRLDGRVGAAAFADLDARLRARDWDGLILRARTLLESEPGSGLAYEIMGVGHFMRGRRDDARAAFERATEAETGQSGPYTKLGILLMEAGQVDQAEARLLQAIKLDPGDRFAHQRLGMLYEYQKKTGLAIRHFARGLEGTDPHYIGVSVNLAWLLGRIGRYPESVAVLEPRLPLEAQTPNAHLILAAAYLATGRLKEAKSRFQRTAALTPDSGEARLGLAMVMRRSGEAEGALDAVRTLLAAKPDWAAAHVERGEALLALDRPADARTAFDRGVALGASRLYAGKRIAEYHLAKSQFPQAETVYRDLVKEGLADPDVFARLSELLLAKGAVAEGEAALRNGLKRFAKDGYLHFRLGGYLASVRRYDDALVAFKTAAELSPREPEVLHAYSLAQSRAGDTRAAADTARRLFELTGKNARTALFYAVQLQADRQTEAAQAMYRYVLEKSPEDALALNNLADLVAGGGAFAEAEALSRRANKVAPDNGRLLDTLGWILVRKGDPAAGVATLKRAAELAPDVPVIHYHLGVALARTRKTAEARAALEKALAAEKDADWADEVRAALARL